MWSKYYSISPPLCELSVCLRVAVDNVSFSTGSPLLFYCCVIVVLWVAFMEQLHCSWFSQGQSYLTHVSALKRPRVQGNQQTTPSSYGSVVLGTRTLINQSALVYADANTAKLSPCPYQLKQSTGQSIILGVIQHVAKVVCAQNVHLVFKMHACYCTTHASLLSMQLLSNFRYMKRTGDEIEGAHSFASIQCSFNNASSL